MVHTCNTSPPESEAEGLLSMGGQPALHSESSLLEKQKTDKNKTNPVEEIKKLRAHIML